MAERAGGVRGARPPHPAGAFRQVHYRTSDGREDYVFDFEPRADGWRIFIVRQPEYGGRLQGLHETHRLRDGDRLYVCWDSPLRTLDDAKAVAALWADATQTYRRSGRFEADSDRSRIYDRSSSARINPVAHQPHGVDDAASNPTHDERPRRPWYWRLIDHEQ